jgi:hypothetical protein
MSTRWRLLFWCSLGTLIGVAWLAETFHTSLWSWMNLELVGMIGAAGFAFAAMITHTRKRGFAAATLVCAAPMGQELYRALRILPDFVRYTGIPGLMMVLGAIGTILIAGFILAAPPPPAPGDPIPRARSGAR